VSSKWNIFIKKLATKNRTLATTKSNEKCSNFNVEKAMRSDVCMDFKIETPPTSKI